MERLYTGTLVTVEERTLPPANDEPEPPAGEVRRHCRSCRAELGSRFYRLGGMQVCAGCGEALGQRTQGQGKLRRGVLVGLVTAGLCAFGWGAATAASGRPLTALALVVGIAVGLAVQQGSGVHGGWRHQLAAVLLVYGTFVGRYVPPVFGGIADAIKTEREVAVAATATATATATTTTTATTDNSGDRTSRLATAKAYFVFTVVAWGLVLASPFLPGTASGWGLLALGAGMAVAFRLNRRVRIEGPFDSP
jgi:hypothetical protein